MGPTGWTREAAVIRLAATAVYLHTHAHMPHRCCYVNTHVVLNMQGALRLLHHGPLCAATLTLQGCS